MCILFVSVLFGSTTSPVPNVVSKFMVSAIRACGCLPWHIMLHAYRVHTHMASQRMLYIKVSRVSL